MSMLMRVLITAIGKHSEMAEGLFNGGLYFRRTHLPIVPDGGFDKAAELPAMANPVGLDLQAVVPEDPALDFLVGGKLTQHNAWLCYVLRQPIATQWVEVQWVEVQWVEVQWVERVNGLNVSMG